jgi:K(+)-stimulated pyrophosphate-energized sodium pump
MDVLAIIVPICAVAALIVAYALASWIGKLDIGTDRMSEISGYIRVGAMAFLKREYKYMAVVIVVFFFVI